MSEEMVKSTTNVVGYFNPHKHPIFIEISEINLKARLDPNVYIRDRQGRYLNDPIFEPYCHPKGLSRATSAAELPINFAPRFVKTERSVAAVTQATGFVRQPDGRTVPTYAPQSVPKQGEANKFPITGMSIAAARKAGLVGKPKLVSEDYGAEETTGAPAKAQAIPGMKYSIESPPRIRTAAPLRPELMEADQDLSPEEKSRRMSLQQSLSQASATPSGETFDPARVRPLAPSTPVPMKAPDQPTAILKAAPIAPASETAPIVPIVPIAPIAPIAPAKTKTRLKTGAKESVATAPQKIIPARRIAKPVEPETVPEQSEPDKTVNQESNAEPPRSGMVQPLDESESASPVMDTPPADEETGKRFICAADGRPFKHRSELERHVKRHYPDMIEQLMAPYPP